jgi:hypothetical protein
MCGNITKFCKIIVSVTDVLSRIVGFELISFENVLRNLQKHIKCRTKDQFIPQCNNATLD